MTVVNLPQGDLSRVISHEPDTEWPTMIEVVAYFGAEGRKGKRRSIEISADEFFGRGKYGAPLSGDRLVQMIHHLRRAPQKK